MTAALLFDFNGVLVDDEEQHCEALRLVLAAEGGLDRLVQEKSRRYQQLVDDSLTLVPGALLAGEGADVIWPSFAGHTPGELLALVDG